MLDPDAGSPWFRPAGCRARCRPPCCERTHRRGSSPGSRRRRPADSRCRAGGFAIRPPCPEPPRLRPRSSPARRRCPKASRRRCRLASSNSVGGHVLCTEGKRRRPLGLPTVRMVGASVARRPARASPSMPFDRHGRVGSRLACRTSGGYFRPPAPGPLRSRRSRGRHRQRSFRRDGGGFDGEKPGAGQSEMTEMDLVPVRHAAALGRIMAHRRNDDSVTERQCADGQWLEESRAAPGHTLDLDVLTMPSRTINPKKMPPVGCLEDALPNPCLNGREVWLRSGAIRSRRRSDAGAARRFGDGGTSRRPSPSCATVTLRDSVLAMLWTGCSASEIPFHLGRGLMGVDAPRQIRCGSRARNW